MGNDRNAFMQIDLGKEERERIKGIIERKIKLLIAYREKRIKHISRRFSGGLKKLQRDIFFLIDNPDYVRKTENKERLENGN